MKKRMSKYDREALARNTVPCGHCKKMFDNGDLGMLSNAIRGHKPACSYKCNKALGQVT